MKLWRQVISVFMLVTFFFFGIESSATEKRRFTVVVDAGHGGKDPGAIGTTLKLKEKTVNLAVALELGRLLYAEPGVRIVYTRKTDVFIPLDERAKIANREKADLFISIHANSARSRSAYGAETFVVGASSKENMEVAMRENSSILFEDNYKSRYGGFDPNQAESYIMFDMMQSAFLSQSIKLAQVVQSQLTSKCDRQDRGVKQAGFLVLRHTNMPSVLIELGYLTNAKEEKYLSQSKSQKEMAKAIFKAVMKYRDDVEKNSVEDVVRDDDGKSRKESKDVKPVAKTDSVVKPADDSKKEKVVVPDTSFYYSIQFCTSKVKLGTDNPKFKSCRPAVECPENTLYKYFYGKIKTYAEAVEVQKRVRKDFPDAFMVVFKDGKKLSSQEASKYMK